MPPSKPACGTYPIFLRIANVIAAIAVIGSCISLGHTQILRIPEEQQPNRIYTIDLNPQRVPRIISATEIPPENFRFGSIPEKSQVKTTRAKVPQKIHPLLQEWIEREVPDAVVEVIITFHEDQKIPRLPGLVPSQSQKSLANQAALKERELIIERLRQQRKAFQSALIQRLQSYGLVVVRQYWLINGLLAELPISSIEITAAQPEIHFIQPKLGGELPPNPDQNPNNDVADARAQIQSDPYFNTANPVSRIAALDSGVRSSHNLLTNPSHLGILGDCIHGGTQCEQVDQNFNSSDACNHGTSTIAIMTGNEYLGDDFRGVTADVVDSFKIYESSNCGLNVDAAVRGFEAALKLGGSSIILVAEIQALEPEGEMGAIAQCANKAYDMGAIVIAANGNCALNDNCKLSLGNPRPGTVRSPALAHKVIGVGAYRIQQPGTTPRYQSLGPAPDGRIKPDLQTPTNTETASSKSDDALRPFTGTSGSTPYAGAAAALVRNWLLNPDNNFGPFDNGQVYSWLINSGQNPSFNNTEGVGNLKLLLGGFAIIGMVPVSHLQFIDIPFSVNSGDLRIDAAIWWPESALQEHNDIDIQILDASFAERANSRSGPSIFERARVDGSPLAQGTWTLRIIGVSVPTAPQKVYYVIHNTPLIP